MDSFVDELRRFRVWIDRGAPDVLGLGHGREWECNYPHWDELWDAARRHIETSVELSDLERRELLYVLARDNEDEEIAEMLSASPRVVEQLLPLALEYPDPDARWQIAMILPAALGDRAIEPLRQLAQDDDEYVRGRARAALSSLDSA
ncbi:HEAT repeat domain-containing protein [Actinoplanes sp. NPDC049668]|uniref:HEAT repeat domain-containing protein n=1 Tax=unclassified Actinoplanes TaxID=2626549 RepID=UPI0033AAA155